MSEGKRCESGVAGEDDAASEMHASYLVWPGLVE